MNASRPHLKPYKRYILICTPITQCSVNVTRKCIYYTISFSSVTIEVFVTFSVVEYIIQGNYNSCSCCEHSYLKQNTVSERVILKDNTLIRISYEWFNCCTKTGITHFILYSFTESWFNCPCLVRCRRLYRKFSTT